MNALYSILGDGKKIRFSSRQEMMIMLTECERQGIIWSAGQNATEYIPWEADPYIYLSSQGRLRCGEVGSVPLSQTVSWSSLNYRTGPSLAFNY